MKRADKILEKIGTLLSTKFNNEIKQLKEYSILYRIESENRELAKIHSKIYSEKVSILHNQIMDDLNQFQDTSEYNLLSQYKAVNKELLEVCNKIENKDLAILYIQHITLVDRGNNNLLKKYSWFTPKHFIPYEWECSFCNTKNLFKSITKSPKNIDSVKCSKCEFELSHYGNDAFKRNYFSVFDYNSLMDRLNQLDKGFRDLDFPNDSTIYNQEVWLENDRFLAFERNKNKLPHKIKKALDLYFKLPNKTDLKDDFLLLFGEISSKDLSKYGIIKQLLVQKTDYEIAKEILYDTPWFHFDYTYDTRGNTYASYIRGLEMGKFKQSLHKYKDKNLQLILKEIDTFKTFDEYKDTAYQINEYYFQDNIQEKNIEKETINIFQSENQKHAYTALRKRHSSEEIIIPNFQVSRIVDFESPKLKGAFSKRELSYLQHSYFNFIVIKEDGTLIKVYNLLTGYHHTQKDYENKDNLKKELCSIFDIELEEILN